MTLSVWRARPTISVIASAAKQSRLPPRRDSGLLRRFAPRNDVERVCVLTATPPPPQSGCSPARLPAGLSRPLRA
ncbi:hypothetical protein BSZ19_40430 [Bradyrhizobium japonicum]|uniref:Uncharacterized protein n=1 Tax=Bradyrhizobium japonicum TaxID=375 RepID=A0A1Y2JBT7_BRAJP|nr:hypothetical protein BSZ19_40430 [Bradyrhizobium japonicum]